MLANGKNVLLTWSTPALIAEYAFEYDSGIVATDI